MSAQPAAADDILIDRAVLERATGDARISFANNGTTTRLGELYQSGSAKIRLPRRHPGEVLEAIVINTSGGLTDGDRFTLTADWTPNAVAILTTQAAERIYKSRHGNAELTTTLRIASGATAFWLPQETILFDGGRLSRLCRVHLEDNAAFLGVESVVFGRTAMGETVLTGALAEKFEIYRNNKRVWIDSFALASRPDATIADQRNRPACLGGAAASATIICTGPDPKRLLETSRNLAENTAVQMAATCREHLVIARIAAKDGSALRGPMMALLRALKADLLQDQTHISSPAALPRVWDL